MWLPAEDLSFFPHLSFGTVAALGVLSAGVAGSVRILLRKMGKLKLQ